MRIVPFFKPSIDQNEIDEVVDTLRSGWLTTGPKAKRFEREFADYLGQKHGIAVNSCTAALHLALEAIGLRENEVVVVPTMTFAATAEVVRYFNARPLLVDCRASDLNIDVADAERKIVAAEADGAAVRAIIPVHYGGQVADMAGVRRLADARGLRVIEDAAHCCPAYYRADATADWLPVGAQADVSCFSFYANKTITTGEGGMACTSRDDLAERMRIMSLHGISRDAWNRFSSSGSWYYEVVAPGFKYNLTDIAASIGLHQLRKAERMHRQRTEHAAHYSSCLRDMAEVELPTAHSDRIHSWHLYAIRLNLAALSIDRAEVITRLQAQGIKTSVHWMPLHMHPYYREKYGYHPSDLPTAANAYQQLITLPLFPDMTTEDVDYVCLTLRNIVAANLKRH